jgi:hypothetical protein
MSEIKVNKISPRTACGTTTLGDSGDTFTIPAGVSITNNGTASGFGATGAVSWNTTVKTGDFTAVAGEGYFVNTTSGAVNVTLPAGSAGSVIGIKDYAGTFDTNAVTLTRNGSDKIGGASTNATLSTEGIAVTLVFIDSTQGWLVTDSGLQSEAPTPSFIAATGGTVLTCGNFKTHVFTGPGTFCVSAIGNPAGSTSVEYMVVAGGGSGGNRIGGGGGAGGFRMYSDLTPANPLNAPAKLPVSATGYPITVGGGGSGVPDGTTTQGYGPDGSNSIFSSITSAGGGAAGPGGTPATPVGDGKAGGSGGGASYNAPSPGGAGNTPPVSPPQGNPGGLTATGPSYNSGAGGGGAAAAGSNGQGPQSGPGGIGSNIPDAFFGPTAPSYGTAGPAGSTRYFAGGGSGGAQQGASTVENAGTPTVGGGGSGRVDASKYDATVNTGGGGGGGGLNSLGSAGGGGLGGSGIVVIRYKFQ